MFVARSLLTSASASSSQRRLSSPRELRAAPKGRSSSKVKRDESFRSDYTQLLRYSMKERACVTIYTYMLLVYVHDCIQAHVRNKPSLVDKLINEFRFHERL